MDELKDNQTLFAFGIQASVTGNPILVAGKVGKAIELNTTQQGISFGVPDERCFGNLNYCSEGFTLAFWMKLSFQTTSKRVFLSSLATDDSGVVISAVLATFNKNYMTLTFVRANQIWSIEQQMDDHWRHIGISWHRSYGLVLYVDGTQILTDTTGEAFCRNTTHINDISLKSVPKGVYIYGEVLLDEFMFWDGWKNKNIMKQLYAFLRKYAWLN